MKRIRVPRKAAGWLLSAVLALSTAAAMPVYVWAATLIDYNEDNDDSTSYGSEDKLSWDNEGSYGSEDNTEEEYGSNADDTASEEEAGASEEQGTEETESVSDDAAEAAAEDEETYNETVEPETAETETTEPETADDLSAETVEETYSTLATDEVTDTAAASGAVVDIILTTETVTDEALAGAAASGTTGDVTWVYYADTGELVISGEGDMGTYSSDSMPWYDYISDIISVTFEEGVTSIGDSAFRGCTSLEEVLLPTTLTRIGTYTFMGCTSLETINIPENVTFIGSGAFYDCTSLEEIYFEGNAPSIQGNSFYNVTATAYYPPDDDTWTSDIMKDYGGTITWMAYDGTSGDAVDIGEAEISLSTTSYTYIGKARKPGVTVTLNGTVLSEGTDYTVSYSDNTDAGTATVTATGTGSYTGSVSESFTITAKSITGATVTLPGTNIIYSGKAKTPEPTVEITLSGSTVTLTEGTDYTLTYSNNTNAGTATVQITGTGNYRNSISRTFTINAKSLTTATVTVSDSYTYTGAAKKPAPTVQLTLNGSTMTLTKDTDYTVSYSDNINAGTATVKVTGTGNFKNSASASFTIKTKSLSGAAVTLSETSYTYTGVAKKPVPTVKLTVNGKTKTLTNGTDYTVTYSDNTNAGTATVKISGTGNYKNSVSISFVIKEKSISSATVIMPASTYVYSGKAKKPAPTVQLTVNGKTKTLTKGTDYTVSYSNNTEAGTAKVKISGIGNYKSSVSKTFTINAKSVTTANVTLPATSYTYTGVAKKPTPTVSLTLDVGTVTLTKGTDYTVTYLNNTDAGTATVKIIGKGNFKNTISVTFTIKEKSISGADVTLSATSYTYDGSAKKPTPTVKLTVSGSTKTLTKDTDYTVTYSNNTAIGTATVKITGKGNYKSSISKTFTIKPAKVTVKSVESVSSTSIKVTWTKISGGPAYQIGYKTKDASSWSYKSVSSSSSSATLGGLSVGNYYYVRIRGYVTGDDTTIYGSWSDTETVLLTELSSSSSGTYIDVTSAYELLNEFRTGEKVWYWNADDSTKTYFNADGYTTLEELEINDELEATARERVKELATSYSHTRPDGTTCFTIYPDDCSTMGENIAAGYGSCSSVITAWEETSDSYSGQGHRRNMLNSSFNAVGIACYKVSSGYKYYWCMALGNK